ncbi:MAG: flagellar hook-length control protein FliK [Proteobacteria bacterium]|nr:flagellar hook-length control protein FliK [Pseudomonadota bacterium]
MKSLLQNNFLKSGLGDPASSALEQGGISDRALGKSRPDGKNSGKTGFFDLLQSSVQESRNEVDLGSSSSLSAPRPSSDFNIHDSKFAQRPSTSQIDVSESLSRKAFEKSLDLKPETSQVEKSSLPTKSNQEYEQKPVSRAEGSTSKDIRDISDERGSAKSAQASMKSKEAMGTDSSEAAATTRNDEKEKLKPLKAAVGGKASADVMIGNNAVLSFMTGRLDRLDPAGIPGIVSSSPFIKQAVSSNEIADLMVQPMAVSDLCQMFEIDNALLSKAVAGGLDSSAIVSPKEFLAAIGVDPGRVSSELSMLHQKLPIEGVKSYVDRARAMNGKGLEAVVVDPSSESLKPVTTNLESLGQNQLQSPSKDKGTDSGVDASNLGLIAGAVAAPASGQSVNGNVNSSANESAKTKPDGQSIGNLPLGQNTEVSSQRKIPDQDIFNSESLMESILASKMSGSNVSNNISKEAAGMPVQSESGYVDMSFNEANGETQNLFDQLGQQMDLENAQKNNFAPTNVSASMSGLTEQLSANGFSIKNEVLDGANVDSVNFDKEEVQNQMSEVPISESNIGSSTKLLDDPQGFSQSSGAETASSDMRSSGFSFSQNSFSEGGQEFSSESKEPMGDVITDLRSGVSTSQRQDFGTTITDVKTQSNSADQSQSQVHTKIMQSASLLLKDGGGSMRLDFESKNLGKIDLAIQLNQNQLDVRIMTPNDQVKDLINKELSGLRDGLGSQGISLRSVEIGQASQSSSHNFSGHFSGGRHNEQQASYNEMKQYAKSFADSFADKQSRLSDEARRVVIPKAWTGGGLDQSRISVRI